MKSTDPREHRRYREHRPQRAQTLENSVNGTDPREHWVKNTEHAHTHSYGYVYALSIQSTGIQRVLSTQRVLKIQITDPREH